MSTTIQDISDWFDEGVKAGADHMVVLTDQFDWDSFPIYTTPDRDVKEVLKEYQNKPLIRIEEVYILDLSKKEFQLHEEWAYHTEAK